ncbi:hypothetical protein PTI98_011469 [Pleurotus ostreatus]|nr:hypothetical protein PTI98_011469 [Pleurotus ostreatus]
MYALSIIVTHPLRALNFENHSRVRSMGGFARSSQYLGRIAFILGTSISRSVCYYPVIVLRVYRLQDLTLNICGRRTTELRVHLWREALKG